MKTCKTCGEIKPNGDFYKTKGGWTYTECKVCSSKRSLQWHRDNPERAKARSRRSWLSKMGVTEERLSELRSAQEGRCWICSELTEDLVIDHDHSCCSGKGSCGECVRGLLCASCNTGLGYFRDREDLLLMAVTYLSHFTI